MELPIKIYPFKVGMPALQKRRQENAEGFTEFKGEKKDTY